MVMVSKDLLKPATVELDLIWVGTIDSVVGTEFHKQIMLGKKEWRCGVNRTIQTNQKVQKLLLYCNISSLFLLQFMYNNWSLHYVRIPLFSTEICTLYQFWFISLVLTSFLTFGTKRIFASDIMTSKCKLQRRI